jgi:hypothetical protein
VLVVNLHPAEQVAKVAAAAHIQNQQQSRE